MPQRLSQHVSFDGVQAFYEHESKEVGLPMRFGIYLPPQAKDKKVSAIVYLAGLTCNEETFAIKAGAQRIASDLGLALITPDTSPRGANIPGESASWDFGLAAGFYLDATRVPWSKNWRMESYITGELLSLVTDQFPIDKNSLGIMGHSMGGHGALTLAFRNPGLFKSLSAFAPISSSSNCPWGIKALSGYLGDDKDTWGKYDACTLISNHRKANSQALYPEGIMVDQGLSDQFLLEQLRPDLLEKACQLGNQPLILNRHAGYDHGYYFIHSFIEKHLMHHAQILRR